jgi:DNA-binding SARP family transcriptional activator
MPAFTLFLLGPVRLIDAEGAEMTCLGAKTRAMLAYLTAQPGRRADRATLADLLWDGVDARHALRQNLLVLRRRPGAATALVRSDVDAVMLGVGVDTDLARFEALLAEGRVEAACGLWRGPFCAGLALPGDRFEDWLAHERARLEQRAAGAFGELARHAEAEGRLEVAITAAQRLVSLNPLDDAAQARLIALYRRRGWSEAARLAHRRCVGLYHRELGIAPGAEVQVAARTPLAAPPGPRHPPRTRALPWRQGLAAAVLLLAAGLAWQGRLAAPGEAEAAPAAWVHADEWRPGAPLETGGLPLAEAIARGLAGDPDFAHLTPGGC